MKELIEILHTQHCSCVINHRGEISIFKQRGVADLYDLYCNNRDILKDAQIADKVVGKGAAAIMVLGGISRVYTDVISQSALSLLQKAGIPTEAGRIVDYIQNRDKTGMCPVESRCMDAPTAEDAWPIIEQFVTEIRKHKS